MKNLLILSLVCVLGCSAAKATPQPGESAAAIALTYASQNGDEAVVTPDVPSARCDGSGVIRHGDGHTTPCPGCENCRKKVSQIEESIISPAIYTRKRQLVDASPAPVDALYDPLFATPIEHRSAASEPAACADGSCSAASAGPIRNAVRAQPVRRAIRGIRERRPVRRLFGRFFCRGC